MRSLEEIMSEVKVTAGKLDSAASLEEQGTLYVEGALLVAEADTRLKAVEKNVGIVVNGATAPFTEEAK